MDWNIPLFIFGGVLLLTAIVGGGLEVERIKIPKVGWIPRLMAGGVGGLLILLGVGTSVASPPAPPPDADPATTAVQFTIHDELGEAQVGERVQVIIDGKEVGVINLDVEGQPSADLDLSVDKAGVHTYRLVSSTLFVDSVGDVWQVDGSGHGTIHIEAGSYFSLWGDYSGEQARVELSPA